jgi:hypothetical protein
MIIRLKRVIQMAGHCGPACISMLFDERGVDIPQASIAQSAGLSGSIQKEGSRIDQLADSVERITTQYVLLARFNCTTSDLTRFLHMYQRPFGIEWQGLFRRENGSTFEEGHYSVIHGYDPEADRFNILDPDSRSTFASGHIPVLVLRERWWEQNLIHGTSQIHVLNRGLAFIVASQTEVEKFESNGFFRPKAHDLIVNNVVGEWPKGLS